MIRVLFVCLGNICRSPTAEGAFTALLRSRNLSDCIAVDSAGTHAYHVGAAPDRRAQAAAATRGYALGHLRGRQVEKSDFDEFDYVLAMDRENLSDLMRMKPDGCRAEVSLFLDFAAEQSESEVPDPYYGGDAGFEHVLDLVEDASNGLLATITDRLKG